MGTVRTIVSLTDPEYFCNKSWTVSYNMNTKSWVSFHSYIPNWYMGENNFFYSGLNECCTEFDFIAGELVFVPTTTTTTTPGTTTTTTTATPLDCDLAGVITITDCELVGNGVITVPPTPPVCTRPINLITDFFINRYDIISPPSTIPTFSTQATACNGILFIQNSVDAGGNYVNLAIGTITVQYASLLVGQQVFAGVANNCTTIPNGFYYTEGSMFTNVIFQVVGGYIVAIINCIPTPTTTTTTSGAPLATSYKARVNAINARIVNVTPVFYTLNPGGAYPVVFNDILYGAINAGGTTFTVEYRSTSIPPQFVILKNNIIVANVIGVQTFGLATAMIVFNFSWLIGDTIEIRII